MCAPREVEERGARDEVLERGGGGAELSAGEQGHCGVCGAVRWGEKEGLTCNGDQKEELEVASTVKY